MSGANENLPPAVIASLLKQLRSLQQQPPEGVLVHVGAADNLATIVADIVGPEETPYFGGTFRCKLLLGGDFPNSPPKAYFLTKIFHPNVSKTGEICVNALKRDWKPHLGIQHTLCVIRCLLIVPNAESALNEEAGRLLLHNYDDYAKRARLFTSIHALPKAVASSSSSAPPLPGVVSRSLQNQQRLGSSTSSSSNVPAAAKARKAAPKKSLRRL